LPEAGGLSLGKFRLRLLSDGEFRLDGGAMFGVVPKPMWEKAKVPDAQNRIRMATNCLLIETGKELVLVDTGIGDQHDAKFAAIYALDPAARRLPASLAAAGYAPEDVTDVVLTHLHFDHCGWNTRREGERSVPTFPRARYWIEKGEVEHARAPSERDRASYFPRNWEPLFEAGQVELFENEIEVVSGVRAVKAPGHNADMCVVTLDGGDGERGVYWADLVPTVAHVPLPWIMGYDLYPMETLAQKKRWLPRAAAESWLCIFEHDAETPVARIVEDAPGRLRAAPLAGEVR